ncbi:MAG TPA: LamG-like jellyroll fold domain-containing protein [Xanthomarina sp.]|nr:LamG-like jellyroll fold domain-containing protein [Xanthomarina sp.]
MKTKLLTLFTASLMSVSSYAQPSATHLNFDGIDDYVLIADGLERDLSYSNYLTVEAWIKTTKTTGNQTILSNHSGPGVRQFTFGLVDDTLQMFLGGGNNTLISDAGVISVDTWHHVAAVYNDAALKLYVDGVEIASHEMSIGYFIYDSFDPYQIGATKDANSHFSGSIEELKVWDIARTPEQIVENSCETQITASQDPVASGLLAYYKFNQGFPAGNNIGLTSLIDNTSNNYDGTLTNFALTGSTSNWLYGSPVVTPNVPTVTTEITLEQNSTASPLTATSSSTGLLWYTDVNGVGSETAPTPNTSTIGVTSFWVSSTNDNGCESELVEIVVEVVETLGVEELDLLGALRVYPNPTNGILNLSSNLDTEVLVTVYDLNGRVLLDTSCNQNSNSINISHLNSGVYILKLKTELGEVSKRVLKN